MLMLKRPKGVDGGGSNLPKGVITPTIPILAGIRDRELGNGM